MTRLVESPPKLLLAEGDPDLAQYLKDSISQELGSQSVEMSIATSAREVEQALERTDVRPNAILMDLENLGDEHGLEFLNRHIEEVRGFPPIVALTTDQRPEMERKCQSLGVKGVLRLPAAPSEIARSVQSAIGKRDGN